MDHSLSALFSSSEPALIELLSVLRWGQVDSTVQADGQPGQSHAGLGELFHLESLEGNFPFLVSRTK